ncbi:MULTISPECIES: LysE family translocator [Pantoea]|nr:LysE family translocator [Pantoea dispersa]KAF0856003.1 lysine transporter LysE [Pantoea dispersa 625]MDT8853079.1 LysE family translocator [Pantoea dispersa]
MLQQFLIVAAAHFLALLSPGPDFFLVARTSIRAGWRRAANVCLGIAIANGVFILAAFSGITLFHPESISFIVIQLAGCAYLLYVGLLFIRFAGMSSLSACSVKTAESVTQPAGASNHYRELGMGFLSGILNPKNALFYVSLATLIGGGDAMVNVKVVYGIWMFSVVLLWDLLVAAFIGNRLVLQHFSRLLPWLERISGMMLIGLALSVIVVNLISIV